MTKPVPPTCEELLEATWGDSFDLKVVERNFDDDWRHGGTAREVFHRPADNTYWLATYRKSTDGETNELREGDALIAQVWPEEYPAVRYVTVAPT